MRAAYMGTPDFAVNTLEKIIEMGHEVCAVFTQPDKPVGRKKELRPPAVKAAALAHGLPVYQPERLRGSDEAERLAELHPDVIVVAAYGQILPREILELPPFGCLNVHASLLPAWRGAAMARAPADPARTLKTRTSARPPETHESRARRRGSPAVTLKPAVTLQRRRTRRDRTPGAERAWSISGDSRIARNALVAWRNSGRKTAAHFCWNCFSWIQSERTHARFRLSSVARTHPAHPPAP